MKKISRDAYHFRRDRRDNLDGYSAAPRVSKGHRGEQYIVQLNLI
jgi:hypothetical protein